MEQHGLLFRVQTEQHQPAISQDIAIMDSLTQLQEAVDQVIPSHK